MFKICHGEDRLALMKRFFLVLFSALSIYSNAQTICGTANEGGSVTLTAPVGNVIISIDFASYGTPNGSCGSFTIGACHASNSVSVCSTAFVGQNSATIAATNAVFGDPCVGTGKRLYIQATYGSTLPLTLISFSARKTEKDKVVLNWSTANEVNTQEFLIERSPNGSVFERTGTVPAVGRNGNNYGYTDLIVSNGSAYFYRLKMLDKDGKFRYSNIVRINSKSNMENLSVYPNPATDYITVTSAMHQYAVITNTAGQQIKTIRLIQGNQTINVESWKPGMYFIRTTEAVQKFIKTAL